MSSLLAPRHSDCFMLDVSEQAPPVAARGSISASVALVLCLVAAALPYVLASRRFVAEIMSFNPVSAHDAHSDVADDNDTSTATSEDGNASLGSMESDVTLVEHEFGDEARGAPGAVDGLLFKIATRELKVKVIAQGGAQKMADDNVAVVEEIQQEIPLNIERIVDQVTVRDVGQTSGIIGEQAESQSERVLVVHQPRTSRRDKKRRKRGRKPGRKLLRRLMAMA